MDYRLWITDYRLWIVDYSLQFAVCGLQIQNSRPHVEKYARSSVCSQIEITEIGIRAIGSEADVKDENRTIS